MKTIGIIMRQKPGLSALPALALMPLQESSDGTGKVIFLIGAAVVALIVLGYLLSRRSRQYPVDSPFSPETRGERTSPSDEDEVETFL